VLSVSRGGTKRLAPGHCAAAAAVPTVTDSGMKQVATVPQIIACKQTPWPLVRKRTIPTERPPLVDEI
jgi:hypothetical protein